MSEFVLKLAGLYVGCKTEYDLEKFCKDYIVNNYAEKENKYADSAHISFEVETKACMNEDYYDFPISEEEKEMVVLLRKVSDRLPEFDCMLMHGSCISYRGKAFILIAPHATGKSTHTKLWINNLGEKIKIVNGDKTIIKFEKDNSSSDDVIKVFGSPWKGKEEFGENICEELFAVVYLSRSEENKVKKVDPKDYIEKILSECYLPKDEKNFDKTLSVVNRLFKSTPLYHLECNMEDEAFFVLKKALYE